MYENCSKLTKNDTRCQIRSLEEAPQVNKQVFETLTETKR